MFTTYFTNEANLINLPNPTRHQAGDTISNTLPGRSGTFNKNEPGRLTSPIHQAGPGPRARKHRAATTGPVRALFIIPGRAGPVPSKKWPARPVRAGLKHRAVPGPGRAPDRKHRAGSGSGPVRNYQVRSGPNKTPGRNTGPVRTPPGRKYQVRSGPKKTQGRTPTPGWINFMDPLFSFLKLLI